MAPVGGTIWAASPARNMRPNRIGSATKLRKRRDALLDRRPGDEFVDRLLVQPALQFVPEPVVRPLLDVIVERALHVIAAAVGRAHGARAQIRAHGWNRSAHALTGGVSDRMPSQPNG